MEHKVIVIANLNQKSLNGSSFFKIRHSLERKTLKQVLKFLKFMNSKLMKSDLSLEGLEQKAKALQQIIDLTSQTNLKLEYEVN